MLSGLASNVTKEAAADEALADTTTPIDASLLDPQDAVLLESLTSQANTISNTLSRFQHSTQGVETHIDNLAESVHKLEKTKEAVDELADRVQSQAAEALERRDQAALERTGVGKAGVGDILRSLARS
jgi:archaellum component FlaC